MKLRGCDTLHRRRNSRRHIAVRCGLRFDLANDAVLFGEKKRFTVRKIVEHLHSLGALEQIGYFHEHLSLLNRVEQAKFQASVVSLRIISFDS